MDFDKSKAKPIHEVMKVVRASIIMQTTNIDVAIPYLQGEPGISKTASTIEMCRQSDWNLLLTHYSLQPIDEISGIPQFRDMKVLRDGKEETMLGTYWSLPDILSNLYNLSSNGKQTVWLLDDFHRGTPEHYSLGYEMFSERKLRGFDIPKNVGFILAGNTSSKAGAKTLFSAIVNRCAMYPVKLDYDYWKSNFAIPHGVNSKVMSFLSNPKNRKYFQEDEQVEKPWSSARSWTRFSNLLNPMEEAFKVIPHHDLLYYAAAHVGDASAGEFVAYYKIFSEVETEKIFDGKIDITIPSDMTGQYVFMLANVSEFFNRYLSDKKSDKRDKVLEIMGHIILKMARVRSEIAVTGLKEIVITENSLKLKDIYFKLKAMITVQDQSIAKRLEADIKLI